MAIRTVLTGEQSLLRTECDEVTDWDQDLSNLLVDLSETMHHYHGVGLAAPQIGVPLRVAVIMTSQGEIALVNPILVEAEGELTAVESCLSFPDMALMVPRPERVVVEAFDKSGQEMRLALSGRDARVACHEIDHLDGILFFDYIPDEDLWTQMLVQLGAYGEEDDEESLQNVFMLSENDDEAVADAAQTSVDDITSSELTSVSGQVTDVSVSVADSPEGSEHSVTTEPARVSSVINPGEVQLALDLISDAAWKLVLATELLRDYCEASGTNHARLAKLSDIVIQLETEQEWWENLNSTNGE